MLSGGGFENFITTYLMRKIGRGFIVESAIEPLPADTGFCIAERLSNLHVASGIADGQIAGG